jgi:hypothetical protein
MRGVRMPGMLQSLFPTGYNPAGPSAFAWQQDQALKWHLTWRDTPLLYSKEYSDSAE